MKSDDYALVLGLRNSHDKMFPAGIVAGASVFVCDNLSFSGEVKFARKHTRFINRDLPQIVERAIGKLVDLWHDQDARIGAYKEAEVDDRKSMISSSAPRMLACAAIASSRRCSRSGGSPATKSSSSAPCGASSTASPRL